MKHSSDCPCAKFDAKRLQLCDGQPLVVLDEVYVLQLGEDALQKVAYQVDNVHHTDVLVG